MDKFNNKNILLFYPYGATKHYGDSIRDELVKRGANVISYDERPSQNSIVKIIIRLSKNKLPRIFLTYIKKVIQENRNIDFDYIVILRGEAFSKDAIELLNNSYEDAIKILFLWDILKTNDKRDVIKYFDKAFSFDPVDAKNNLNLKFRPTFFMPQYKKLEKSNNQLYDIAFIGTLHGNRYEKLNSIRSKLSKNKTMFYFYVPSVLVYIKNKIIKNNYASLNEVSFKPLSFNSTLKVISNSKCLLDINYPGQTSLSMRAYEAMASKTKYITNNKEIMKYDFYNPNNIFVLDDNDLDIPLGFFETPFEEVPSDVLLKYSVESFVDEIFK